MVNPSVCILNIEIDEPHSPDESRKKAFLTDIIRQKNEAWISYLVANPLLIHIKK